MAVINTHTAMRNTVESARRLRYEPTAPFTSTNVQAAIEQGHTLQIAVTPTVVTAAMSPYVPAASDTYLRVNTSGGPVTINMPASASRTNFLTIKDVTGNAGVNPISVVANGAETSDGLATYPLNGAFVGATFVPKIGGYDVRP